MTSTALVLADVVAERKRQDDKWGPDTGASYNVDPYAITDRDAAIEPWHAAVFAAHRHGISTEQVAKNACEHAFKTGRGSWAHILIEEVAESVSAAAGYDYEPSAVGLAALRAELVQVAAVAVKWVEHLDKQQLNSETQQ